MANNMKAPFGGEPYVFISYSHKDSGTVLGYIRKLEKMGYRIWYDEAIPYTSKYDDIIANAINNCTLFTVFFTRASAGSEYVLDEVHTARDKNKIIHPVFLEDVILPEGTEMRLRRTQQLRRSKYASDQAFFDELRKPMEICRSNEAEKAITVAKPQNKPGQAAERQSPGPEPAQPQPVYTAPSPAQTAVDANVYSAPKHVPGKAGTDPVKNGNNKRWIVIASIAIVAAIIFGAIIFPKSPNSGVAENSIQSAPSTTTTQSSESNISVSVGDYVYFGSYPQTEDGEIQPIEWRVLDIVDGKALMISEYLLDAHRFDNDRSYWESSELRTWLNDDFMNKAFTADEQQKLSEINGDKVSLLTKYQAKEYFNSKTDRRAKPTAYAKKRGATVNDTYDTGWWWLCSPGGYDDLAAYVGANGGILYHGGYLVDLDYGSVRPVVLASL